MATVSTLDVRIRVIGLSLARLVAAAHMKLIGDPEQAARYSGRFMLVFMKPPSGRWKYAGRVTKNKGKA